MIDKPHFFPIATCLLLLIGVAVAQNDTGGISQPGQKDDTPPTSTTSAGNSKPLPWKFLAQPNGVLAAEQWGPLLKSLNCDNDDLSKCPLPDQTKLNDLFTATFWPKRLPRTRPIYVVLHLVENGDSATRTASAAASQEAANKIADHWYLYRSSKAKFGEPKWTYAKFTGQRIYGAPTVFFLFLHENTRSITVDHAVSQITCLVDMVKGKSCPEDQARKTAKKEQLDATTTGALNGLKLPEDPKAEDETSKEQLRDLRDQIRSGEIAMTPFCDTITGDKFEWSNQGGISSRAGRIRYEAAVVKRTPANVDHFKAILGLLGLAKGKPACIPLVSNDIIWGAGTIDNIGLPSDITIAGYNVKNDEDVDKPVLEADRSKLQLGTTGSYNNEQLYWWDASIGIPVHTIKDLQYSDTDNTVTATQVDKQSAYAMFNLMLLPVDLSNSGDNIKPRLLVGFPLASDPWDKLFAGGAIGLPWKPFRNFQFFAGATFLRTSSPSTLAAGDTATTAQLLNDLTIKMTPKFTFGINVPVKSVIDKLK